MDVAVVIPVFNPGRFLVEQLEALAAQRDAPDFEVVLSDNGTTDGALAVVETFSDRLSVRVVQAHERRGPSHARNRGAAETTAQWLAFCDADDVADVHWLARLWAARDATALTTGVCDVTQLNPPEILMARGGAEYGRTLAPGPCQFLPFAPSGHVLMAAEQFRNLGGWNEDLPYCEDVDFSWRAQLAGTELVFVPDAVMHYRFRDSSRALFRQVRCYKEAEVGLFIRYREHGARRPGTREALHGYWWLLTRGPYVFLDKRRRYVWWSVFGSVTGRLAGSLRHRVVYL